MTKKSKNTKLEFTPRSCWETYSSAADTKKMAEFAGRYIDFLTRCKTERETVEYVLERLKKAGFSEDFSQKKIVRQFRNKSLFFAVRGKKPLSAGLHLIGAHIDTPRLDLKQRPLQEQAAVAQAKTHYYGGIRKYQWLARPLALHGVVVRQNGEVIKVTLGEDASEPVFTIADLLPHLAQKQAGQPLSEAFDAEKLNIVIGHSPLAPNKKGDKEATDKAKDPAKAHVLELLHAKYGIIEEDLYSAELQAVPAGPARFVGLDSSLIGGYGHDDRVCAFCALEAALDAGNTDSSLAVVLWDKEEIGSEGSTGAKSYFFEYCVEDMIAASSGKEAKTRFADVMQATKALSADVHAAIDPDWQELHEKLNAAQIGNGPCFCKFTGSRGKYSANDAHPEYIGWLRNVLNKAEIPWQMAELGKVDSGGGGTVAMYLAKYGMDIIDFGPAVLSMHSPFELVSKADLYATKLAYEAFFKG